MKYLPMIMAFLLLASITTGGSALALSTSGSINQLLGNNKVQLYVSDVKVSTQSTAKVVTVTAIFKNLDFQPTLFNYFYIKLKDSEGIEYTPEIFESKSTDTYVPEKDIATGDFVFTIPSTGQPTRFTYTELFESPLSVDLTKSMATPDAAPESEWDLGSNKGYSSNDGKMELVINDEVHISGNYVLDITIRNIGKEKFAYNPLYAYVKDSAGYSHSQTFFADLSKPLSYGDLMPGDFVRGEVAFEVDEDTGPFMFIWQGNFGFDSYFNTGTPNFQTPANPTPQPEIDELKTGMEATSLSSLKTIDFSGRAVNQIQVGAQLLLMTEITNNNPIEQPFFAMFEMRDENGVTLSLQVVTSKLAPNDSAGAGVSWMPGEAGTYEVRIFVVSSLSEPEVLSPISSNTLTVMM